MKIYFVGMTVWEVNLLFIVFPSYSEIDSINFYHTLVHYGASQVALVVKNPPANAGDIRDLGSISWAGKIPWRRAWQPTPVFLSGESHGQRRLAGYGS